jgi:hypothetical protein
VAGADEQPVPVLRELRGGIQGPYWQEWYCDVPPDGVAFTVIRERWMEGYSEPPVRMIEEIRLL